MRSLPATGRRLLQAISTRHVRSVLSAGPLTTARLAPAKALASGAAVVAAGALLIPTGQAIAQGSHPATEQAAVTTAAAGADSGSKELKLQLPSAAGAESEQVKNVKDAISDALGQDGSGHQDGQPQHQDEQASRSEQRTGLTATDQAATPAAEQQPAAQQATEQAAAPAAEQQAAPAAAAPTPEPEPTPTPAPEPVKPSWSSPAPGATISNPYHKTNAAYAAGYHTGTDFAVSVGTPVLAVGDATVVSSGYAGAYGNQIVLKLSDGRFAQYAHLSQLGVKAGQHVEAGQQVGKSGNTGNSHGPHLHFEIRTANQYAKVIDPVGYLKQHGANNF
ncbi:M23 family metallopeptidase [Kitasatospora sp. NPDC057198]|uniref:M23 family metallopeptidase n=1 Tax=Kitasatospora sp. NPDC057198 TaxID=3346046 RepID=UPI003639956A